MRARNRWLFGAALGVIMASLAGVAASGPSTSYTYDSLGRVTKVTINDGSGGASAVRVIEYSYDAAGNRTQKVISAAGGNHTPTPTADSISVTLNTALTFDPRSNDTDPDGDALTVTSKTNGSHGTVAINAGGASVTYTPTTGYTGTDTFTYVVSDGYASSSSTQVSVAVNQANHPPVATTDTKLTAYNTAATITPLSNDTDADSDTLSIAGITQPGHGTASLSGSTITYTPTTGFVGADVLYYAASDGHGGVTNGTINVTVDAPNTAPTAVNDSAHTSMALARNVKVLANDTDADSADIPNLVVSAKTDGAHGAVTIAGDAKSVNYTPTSGYSGSDSFTYTLSDQRGGTATATVVITVNSSNTAPTPVNDSVNAIAVYTGGSVGVQPTITFDPRVNDGDPDDDNLTITAKTNGAKGTVSFTSSTVTYTFSTAKKTDFETTDSFTYTVSDGQGHTATATVTVDIIVTTNQ